MVRTQRFLEGGGWGGRCPLMSLAFRTEETRADEEGETPSARQTSAERDSEKGRWPHGGRALHRGRLWPYMETEDLARHVA